MFIIFHAVFFIFGTIFGDSSAHIVVIAISGSLQYGADHRCGIREFTDVRVIHAVKSIRVDDSHLRIAFGNFLLNNFARNYAPELVLSPAVRNVFHYPAFIFDIIDGAPIIAVADNPARSVFIAELGHHNFQRIFVGAFGVNINIFARIYIQIELEIDFLACVVEISPIVKRYRRFLAPKVRSIVRGNFYRFIFAVLIGNSGSRILCNNRKRTITQLFQFGKNISGDYRINISAFGGRYNISAGFRFGGNGSGSRLRRNETLFYVLVAVRANTVAIERMFGNDFFGFPFVAFVANSFS